MMKLGKEALLAIVESALFVMGAIFFLLVVIIPSNPVWALIAGILCGLAGAIVWSYPFFVRLTLQIRNRIKDAKANPATGSRSINDSADDTYELHRANSYDNLADEIIAQAAPVPMVQPEPTTANIPQSATTAEPVTVSRPAPKPMKPTQTTEPPATPVKAAPAKTKPTTTPAATKTTNPTATAPKSTEPKTVKPKTTPAPKQPTATVKPAPATKSKPTNPAKPKKNTK